MFRTRFTRALVVATAGTLIMASAAFADVVSNNLDATVDATAETMNLTVGEAGQAVTMRLLANDNSTDAINGCNLGGQNTQVTFGVKSTTGFVWFSASTIQFTACDGAPGSTATFTVNPVAAGNATITLSTDAADGFSITTNKGATAANYDLAPATFNVVVAPAAVTNQAPSTPDKPGATSPTQGGFTLSWTASTDDGLPTPPSLTYELQGTDADDPGFASVATGITSNSYAFASGQPAEGTWTYQVRASDSALTSDWSATSDPIVVDRTKPTFGNCSPTSFVRHSGDGSQTVSITASDPALPDGSAGAGINSAASTLSGSISTATLGERSFTFTAVDGAGNTETKECKYQVVLSVAGFDRPVDMNVRNLARAGQAIPLKFSVSDALGPVTDLTASDVLVKVANLSCDRGVTLDQVEEYATGSSGLQNLGGGDYQFNWKTPNTYANSCKTMTLTAGGGAMSAEFEFRK